MKSFITIKNTSKVTPMSLGRKLIVWGLLALTIVVFSFAIFVLIIAYPYPSPKPEVSSVVKGLDNSSATDLNKDSSVAYDVEINEPFEEELLEYLDQLVFFLYLNDSAFRLMDEDMKQERVYVNLIRLNGELCPYEKYEGVREGIPLEIQKKLNNIETLNRDFCDELFNSSNLMINYLETENVEELKDLISEIREINEENYKNRLLIEKISKEIISVIE